MAVDSSVLLDVITDSSEHAATSEIALRRAASEGSLLINECVLAEIRPALSKTDLLQLIRAWRSEFVPSSLQSALFAGSMLSTHLKRGGKGGRVVADFPIASHALCDADRLLSRDRGYWRDYFKELPVMGT